MTNERLSLIRDASRRSLDEGTEWRDRMDRWLCIVGRLITIPAHYHVEFSDAWTQIMKQRRKGK